MKPVTDLSRKWIVVALAFCVQTPLATLGQELAPLPQGHFVKAAPAGKVVPLKTFAGWTETAVEAADAPSAAPAADLDSCDCPRKWSLRVIPYMWLAQIQGDVTVRRVTAPVDLSLSKMTDLLLNDLNFAALGQVEASNGRFGVIFNGVYMNLSPEKQVRNLDFSTNIALSVLDLTGTYDLNTVVEKLCLPPGSRLQALAGVRYYSISAGVTITGPRGNTASREGTEEWLDPIIGGRLRVPLGTCLTAQVRGDVGGFDVKNASILSWNVEAMLEVRCSSRLSMTAGYRWLDYDRRSGSGNREFGLDLNFNGPVAGIVFDF